MSKNVKVWTDKTDEKTKRCGWQRKIVYSKRQTLSNILDTFFATNSNFRVPTSLKPNGVNHWYFKLSLFYVAEISRCTKLGWKDIGTRTSEIVAKAKVLYPF